METKAMITKIFKNFQLSILFTVCFFFVAATLGKTVPYFIPNIGESLVYQILIGILFVGIVVGYIFLLTHSYKLAKLLKIAGKMKARPSLILILMILSTNILFLVNIIILIVLGNKTSAYLKEMPAEVKD